jgi:NADH-quinone oxidoreductase E subunit
MGNNLSEILTCHKKRRESLIPILQKIQDKLGYITGGTVSEVAEYLKISESEVFGVASFYTGIHLTPRGKYSVKVCEGTACHVRAGERILDEVERKLGIKHDEITEDGKFSLERVACFGSCALAPVMVVNKDVYGHMTVSRVVEILRKYQ